MLSGREGKHQRLLLNAAWLISAWILAVGCNSSGPGALEVPNSTSASSDGSPQLVLNAVTKELFKNSSAFQQSIAADGVIDLPEYDGAALAMVSCMKERGFSTAQEPLPDALHRYRLVFAYGAGQLEAGRSANQECFKEYFSEITLAWADFVAPDGAKVIAEAQQAVLACYRERLVHRAAPTDGVEFQNAKDALMEGDQDAGDCFARARTQFNLPFWGG